MASGGWGCRLGMRQERVNDSKNHGENSCVNPGNQLIRGSLFRPKMQSVTTNLSPINVENISGALQKESADSNLDNGPEEDELDGLQITERKRMRGGPSTYEVMDTEGGLKLKAGVDDVSMETHDSSKNLSVAGAVQQPRLAL